MSGFVRMTFAVLPDLRPPLGLGVAVVDGRAQAGEPQAREAARLVLGERLRRVEVEGPGRRLARDRVEHRQVERERLPRRGGRGDDDVLASCGGLPRLGLLGIEAADAGRRERVGDAAVETLGQRLDARSARRLGRAERELLSREEIVPRRGHASRYGANARS